MAAFTLLFVVQRDVMSVIGSCERSWNWTRLRSRASSVSGPSGPSFPHRPMWNISNIEVLFVLFCLGFFCCFLHISAGSSLSSCTQTVNVTVGLVSVAVSSGTGLQRRSPRRLLAVTRTYTETRAAAYVHARRHPQRSVTVSEAAAVKFLPVNSCSPH